MIKATLIKHIFIIKNRLIKYGFIWFLSWLLFCFFEIIPPVNRSKESLFCIFFLETWAVYKCDHGCFFKMHKDEKKYWLIIMISSIFLSFSLSGIWLFWDKTIASFSLSNIFLFLCVVLWCIPIVMGGWEFLDALDNKIGRKNYKKVKQKKIIYLLMGAGLALYLIAYNPFLSSLDVMDQLGQIISSDYKNHSLAHTFFIKVIWEMTGNIVCVPIFQIVLFIFIIALANRSLNIYKTGKFHYIVFIFLSLNILNGIMLLNIWKDSLFTCMLLMLTIVCAKFLSDDTAIYKMRWSIMLGISICGVWLLRLNGILAAFAAMGLIIVLCVKNKKNNWKPLLTIVLSVVFVLVIYPAIEEKYNFKEDDQGRMPIRLMHTMASVAVTEGFDYLDKQTRELFEKVCDEETWKENYDPFNTDAYSFETSGWLEKVYSLDTREVYTVFIKNLIKHPFEIGMARLCGSESMWNIVQAEDSFNYVYDRDFLEDMTREFGFVRKTNILTKAINSIYNFVHENVLLDTIFLRQGIWVDILLLLTTYGFLKKKRRVWMSLPIWANILSLAISMGCQHARYIWFIEICTIIFGMAVLSEKQAISVPLIKNSNT